MTAAGHGSLGEEATALVDALLARLSAARDDAAARAGQPGTDSVCAHCGHDPAVRCSTGCPLCQLLAVIRGERPDQALRLLDGSLAVLTALRGVFAEAAGGFATVREPARRAAPPDVEHIEVR